MAGKWGPTGSQIFVRRQAKRRCLADPSSILGEQPDLVNVHMAENNEHMRDSLRGDEPARRCGPGSHGSGRGPQFGHLPPPRRHRRVYDGAGTRPGRNRPRDQGGRRKTQAGRLQEYYHHRRKTTRCSKPSGRGGTKAALDILDRQPELLDACHRNGGSVIHAAASHGPLPAGSRTARSGRRYHASHARGPIAPRRRGPQCTRAQQAAQRRVSDLHGHPAAGGMRAIDRIRGRTWRYSTSFARFAKERIRNAFSPTTASGTGFWQIAVRERRYRHSCACCSTWVWVPDDRHQLQHYESRPYSWGEPLVQCGGRKFPVMKSPNSCSRTARIPTPASMPARIPWARRTTTATTG